MAVGDKIAGIDVLVKVNTGTAQTPVYTVVGGQSGASLSRSMSMIEVTNKQSAGWVEKLGGNKEWSVECDAFMVLGDSGYKALSDAFRLRTKVKIELAIGTGIGSIKLVGDAFVTDLPFEFGQDDAVTFSITLEGTGELVETISAT
jgi:TP901-1 family phage major tail protein